MHSQSRLHKRYNDESSPNFIVTMRPVYEKNFEVVALYPVIQSLDPESAIGVNDIEAFGVIISETYGKISKRGETKVVPCFLQLTSSILEKLNLPNFSDNQYIFEFTPNIDTSSDQNSLEAEFKHFVSFLKDGYRLAVRMNEDNIHQIDKFIPLVKILIVDVSRPNFDLVDAILKKIEGQDIDLLANNLTCKADFEQCLEHGFTHFSGDVFGKPDGSSKKKISHNKTVLLDVLAELQNPDSSNDNIAAAILVDAKLTYKLLKVVNSAGVGLSHEVSSISQAIRVIGLDQLRRWVSLFLLDSGSEKSTAIMRSSLIRARMCELLAALSSKNASVPYFMVGLLSQLDIMTDIQMADLILELPLSDEIKAALISRQGDMGQILSEVELYLEGEFGQVHWLVDPRHYETCYRHSVTWATNIQKSMAQ